MGSPIADEGKRKRKVRSTLPGSPDLMTHRDVAAKIGLPVETLRSWIERGKFPAPHSVIENTMFYRVELIGGWLESGLWPAQTKFSRAASGSDPAGDSDRGTGV